MGKFKKESSPSPMDADDEEKVTFGKVVFKSHPKVKNNQIQVRKDSSHELDSSGNSSPNISSPNSSDSSDVDIDDNSDSDSVMSEVPTVMTIEEMIDGAQQAWMVFVNNQYVEGFRLLEEKHKSSFYHSMYRSLCQTLRYLFTLKEQYYKDAYDAVNDALKFCNERKPKKSATSRASSFIFKQSYDHYTDEECHAELACAIVYAASSLITVTHDQSIGGYIQGAMKIRSCYNEYRECDRILKHRKKWNNERMKRHFEAGVLLGLGMFDMSISLFPSKLIKLLEMAGFSGNRSFGVNQLLACERIQDSIWYPACSVSLSGYFGFVEYFYGLGEPDVDCILRILNFWLKQAPQSVAVTFGCAFREQSLGNFDLAAHYYDEYTSGQKILRSFHFISNWQKMWLYSCMWNWRKAAENSKNMYLNCRWSPSLFAYCYAAHLSMIADENHEPDLMKEVIETLHISISKKRNFGGRRAFHEKLVLEKAKFYTKNPDKIVLLPLDLMYLWNSFSIAANNPNCLPLIVGKIEEKMKIFTQDSDLEIFTFLTFMKGVCLSHSNCPLLAVECLYDVLDREKCLVNEKHLVPQACFEVGQIYRRMGDVEESKKWYKKARSYSGYITESLIKFRVEYGLSILRSNNNSKCDNNNS